ncbi:MAG TPA: bifunctional YncE family protein/alkaline phosphatase family protein [Gemmatimonadaceae bacterium]|nr:bifunctional YncE family protein/alkaline phosphatase family protein [Gemmatimonadaceae bacterium]
MWMPRAALIAIAAIACSQPRTTPNAPSTIASGPPRLSTGVRLDPAGRSMAVGNMPLAAVPSPDGRWLVLSMSGYREQGIEILDRATGAVVERVEQPGAFLGLAWSADGRTLYVSGGVADALYVYSWRPDASQPAVRTDSILLGHPRADTTAGSRYAAGIALSADGHMLYVAEDLSDSLAVIDLAARRVIQRVSVGQFPYGVVASTDGRVYASAWGDDHVAVFHAGADGRLITDRPINAGRHPSALLLARNGSLLYVASASTDRVAIIDPAARRVLRWLIDSPPDGMTEGSTPNAMALAPDGSRLYVAEADANAVAVFDLQSDTLAGRIPTEWYPSAIVADGDSLWVVNGKGRGAGPNPRGPQPNIPVAKFDVTSYTLGQLNGTVTVLPAARGAALDALSARVARANRWDVPRGERAHYPPISHVVYIIKENRTFDQVLGDLKQADGDTSLLFFPRAISPNHHALAERFGIFDRFFTNAEVSEQGHPWSTSAYVTDYSEKNAPSTYRGKRPEPDELGGTDDPANGYLWDAARRAHITFRDYGEYVESVRPDSTKPPIYRAGKPGLAPYTSPIYPPFDLTVRDQVRADAWLTELHGFEQSGQMPALELMHLPSDHTAGPRSGMPTPRAYMADNDLALGRIIEGLSRSKFWSSTVVFVLEDDAQDGPDHVDSHRSVMLAISPWTRGGTFHRFVNTTDVVATIEEILGMPSLSQYDHFGRPLRDIWTDHPDLRPYVPLIPSQALGETNVATGPDHLDFSRPDRVDDALFNHLLWQQVKGPGVPYPAIRRAPVQELVRSQ